MDRINTTVFELFTTNARQIVVNAASHARELGHDHLEPEHLLLGALSLGRGVAHDVLAGSGLGLDQARAQVVHELGEGSPPAPGMSGQIPFSSAAKGVLDASLDESRALGHAQPHIGSGHVLLGLLAPGCASTRVIEALGHDVGRIRAETLRLLREE
jgi:ATP-dependent Clp protease ATP-binding subunit ClpC